MNDSEPTAPREEVLSSITGDRACASCGFNLHGQQVFREPHYKLVAARCPECGTLAALQEYPALGKWTRRWALVLAGLWAMVLFASFAGTSMTAFGLTVGAVETASENAGSILAYEYSEWARNLDDSERSTLSQSYYFGSSNPNQYARWDEPDEAWPHYNDPAALLDGHGGAWGTMDRAVVWLWIVSAFVACPFGMFWSLAMLHQRAWVAAAVPVGAVVIASVLFISFAASAASPPFDFNDIARNTYAPLIGPISLGTMALSAVLSSMFARPLARLVVRMALPPRLRVPFGALWSSAGKPMPRPR